MPATLHGMSEQGTETEERTAHSGPQPAQRFLLRDIINYIIGGNIKTKESSDLLLVFGWEATLNRVRYAVMCWCSLHVDRGGSVRGSATCWVCTTGNKLNRKTFPLVALQSELSVRHPYVGLGSAGLIDFDRLLIC